MTYNWTGSTTFPDESVGKVIFPVKSTEPIKVSVMSPKKRSNNGNDNPWARDANTAINVMKISNAVAKRYCGINKNRKQNQITRIIIGALASGKPSWQSLPVPEPMKLY